MGDTSESHTGYTAPSVANSLRTSSSGTPNIVSKSLRAFTSRAMVGVAEVVNVDCDDPGAPIEVRSDESSAGDCVIMYPTAVAIPQRTRSSRRRKISNAGRGLPERDGPSRHSRSLSQPASSSGIEPRVLDLTEPTGQPERDGPEGTYYTGLAITKTVAMDIADYGSGPPVSYGPAILATPTRSTRAVSHDSERQRFSDELEHAELISQEYRSECSTLFQRRNDLLERLNLEALVNRELHTRVQQECDVVREESNKSLQTFRLTELAEAQSLRDHSRALIAYARHNTHSIQDSCPQAIQSEVGKVQSASDTLPREAFNIQQRDLRVAILQKTQKTGSIIETQDD